MPEYSQYPNQDQSAIAQMQQPQPDPLIQAVSVQEPIDPETAMEEKVRSLHDYALSTANLAKKFRKKKTKYGTPLLEEMGRVVYEGYMTDLRSCDGWLKKNVDYIKMATLVCEQKTFPWPDASNVKFPLLATACMQFAARAYPSLVPNHGQIVKGKVIGYDSDGVKAARAERVARHMSYQIMHHMENWEEEMDRLCMVLPMVGVIFKKTYHKEKYHCSEILLPHQLIINYDARTIEKAYRKTEIIELTKNEVLEKIRDDELFLDVLEEELERLPHGRTVEGNTAREEDHPAPQVDKSTPHVFLSQHTYWDLDDDGYEEPYIITIHKDTQKVVRIVARWDSDGIEKNDKDEIMRIVPVEYFTKFGFVPNPESAIYDNGFGCLLGPLNDAVDTILNQLIDAGTLNNLQSGFLSKGLQIKMGATAFKPGEWKVVRALGDEMKNGIVPLPTKEPSPVLFNLLQMLIASGNQLASISEIMVGKMPGQNTPATTTQEAVDQGMKVFTAIYKRLFRALDKEFKKIYRLNRIYPQIVDEENSILNLQLTQNDYHGAADDIFPSADPTGDSVTVKMMKYQQVGQMLLPLGTVNAVEFSRRVALNLEIPNVETLVVEPPPPPPDPKVQSEQMKAQSMQQKGELDREAHQMKMAAEQQKLQIEKELGEMKLQIEAMKIEMEQRKAQMDLQQKQVEGNVKRQQASLDMQTQVQSSAMDLQMKKQQNDQMLRQSEQSHKQKMTQQSQQNKAKQQQAKKPKNK